MTDSDALKLEELEDEVARLKTEINDLKEFVKTLYSMIDEGQDYEQPQGMMPAVDFGGMNN